VVDLIERSDSLVATSLVSDCQMQVTFLSERTFYLSLFAAYIPTGSARVSLWKAAACHYWNKAKIGSPCAADLTNVAADSLWFDDSQRLQMAITPAGQIFVSRWTSKPDERALNYLKRVEHQKKHLSLDFKNMDFAQTLAWMASCRIWSSCLVMLSIPQHVSLPTLPAAETDLSTDSLTSLEVPLYGEEITLQASLSNSSDSCSSGCTIGEGVTNEACDWYTSPSSLQWLPTNYAMAAGCACTGSTEDPQPWESPSAQCVRGSILNQHQNLSPDLVAQLQSWKDSYPNCTLAFECPSYYSFLQGNFLPAIYKIHSDAYASCCCPGSVAPLWAWNQILVTPYDLVPCSLIPLSIELVGACGCQGW